MSKSHTFLTQPSVLTLFLSSFTALQHCVTSTFASERVVARRATRGLWLEKAGCVWTNDQCYNSFFDSADSNIQNCGVKGSSQKFDTIYKSTFYKILLVSSSSLCTCAQAIYGVFKHLDAHFSMITELASCCNPKVLTFLWPVKC